jgi:hypothetical protein
MKQTWKRTRSNRRGVAVLELLVWIIVLSIGLLGVGGMTVAASRRASGLSMESSRNGIVLQELNKLSSLPYDSLGTRVGCVTSTAIALTYTRCVAVTNVDVGLGYKRVRLIVTPATTYARPETVYVNRSKGAAVNPLGS